MAFASQVSSPKLAADAWNDRFRRAREGVVTAWDSTSAVRRSLRERLSVFTGLGALVAIASVLALCLGLIGSWSELTVLATSLFLALGVAVAWIWGKVSYEARIDLQDTRVRVGDEAIGRLLITNQSKRSLLPTRIELPVAKAVASFDLPSLGRDEEDEQLFAVPTRRRGVIPVGPVRSVRVDPLQLLRRAQSWTERIEVFVHPRTVVIDSNNAGFLKDVEGVTTQDLSSSDVSFHALREYVPGDDRRAIHWRTTARVGRFMVRVFEETRRSHLLVMLSVRPEDYLAEDDFETAISCAGSLGVQCFREDRQFSVMTQAGELRFPSGPGLLDALSRVELVPGADSVERLVERGVSTVPGASIMALVTGGQPSAQALRAVDISIPLDAYSFALRCDGETAPALRKIGRLSVLDLSTLDELPRAMRTLR